MKVKSTLGMGMRKKRKSRVSRKRKTRKIKRKAKGAGVKFSSIVSAAKKNMKNGKTASTVIKSALHAARKALKTVGGKKKIIMPRILPVSSKMGGALPFLIPLFAGLSATGALAGGAAGIAKAVNEARAARDELSESKRHNKTIEAIALGKGLYLKPHKRGFGLYLGRPFLGQGLKRKRLF